MIQVPQAIRPPSTDNGTNTTLSAGTASAALATGAVADSEGLVLAVACPAAFNIRFGLSTVSDPAASYAFPAGVHLFQLNGRHTHFKIITAGASFCCHWQASHA